MGAKEVAAGAQWLDENFPGWEREIDLGTLNIRDRCACICGQSLRSYVIATWDSGYDFALRTSGVYGLGGMAAFQWAASHGFAIEADEPIWVELIKERFSTGNLSDNDG